MEAGRWIYAAEFLIFGLPAVFALGTHAAALGVMSLVYLVMTLVAGASDPMEQSELTAMSLHLLLSMAACLGGLWALVLFVKLSIIYVKRGAQSLAEHGRTFVWALGLAAIPGVIAGSAAILQSRIGDQPQDFMLAVSCPEVFLAVPVVHLGIVLLSSPSSSHRRLDSN